METWYLWRTWSDYYEEIQIESHTEKSVTLVSGRKAMRVREFQIIAPTVSAIAEERLRRAEEAHEKAKDVFFQTERELARVKQFPLKKEGPSENDHRRPMGSSRLEGDSD